MKLRIVGVAAVTALALVCSSTTLPAWQIPNPSDAQNAAARNNPCRDPWISQAHVFASQGVRKAGGYGDIGDCNKDFFNGGRWGSYAELVNHVRSYQDRLNAAGLEHVAAGRDVLLKELGREIGRLIGDGGGTLREAIGARIVAGGGGNYGLQNVRESKNLGGGLRLIK